MTHENMDLRLATPGPETFSSTPSTSSWLVVVVAGGRGGTAGGTGLRLTWLGEGTGEEGEGEEGARTEQEVHGAHGPPPEEHKEGHPPEDELDAQVDRAAAREHRRRLDLLARDVVVDGLQEEHDRDRAVRREGDEWEEDEAEPPGGRDGFV